MTSPSIYLNELGLVSALGNGVAATGVPYLVTVRCELETPDGMGSFACSMARLGDAGAGNGTRGMLVNWLAALRPLLKRAALKRSVSILYRNE